MLCHRNCWLYRSHRSDDSWVLGPIFRTILFITVEIYHMTKLNISISYKTVHNKQPDCRVETDSRWEEEKVVDRLLSCDKVDIGIYASGTLRFPLDFYREKDPYQIHRRHFSISSSLSSSADFCDKLSHTASQLLYPIIVIYRVMPIWHGRVHLFSFGYAFTVTWLFSDEKIIIL